MTCTGATALTGHDGRDMRRVRPEQLRRDEDVIVLCAGCRRTAQEMGWALTDLGPVPTGWAARAFDHELPAKAVAP